MRLAGPVAFFVLGVAIAACATGTATDDTVPIDSGTKQDTSVPKDSAPPPPKDSSPPKDTSPPVEAAPCGGQCLGLASTCCNNVCVDITGDSQNCGGCGTSCGTTSCCAGNCVDTMGSDNSNCGNCGVTCSGTCVSGVCQTTTPDAGSCTLDLGSCAHSPCTTGGALSASCDSSDEGIVFFVCFYDPTCCSTTWDSTCVGWATLFETYSCSGGGC
jgi:hypothetical protein